MLPFPHRARPEIRNEVRNNRMTVFPAPKPEIRSVYRSILKATTDKINRKTSPANRYKERQYWRKVVPQSDDLSDAPNPIIESISFRNLLNRVHDNSYFSVFALSLAILTLVPLMLKISFQLESSNLSKAIRSPEFLGITSASIALTGPVLMDVILDLYTDKTANFHSYNHILFTVVPCIVFFQGDTLYDFETCFICFFYAQLLSCSAIAFSLLMKSCPKVFTPFRCYFLLTTFGINVFLHLYGFSVGDNSAKMGGLVLHQIFLVLCLIIAITYSSYFYLHHKDLFHSMQFRKIISQLSTDEYSTLFAISGGIVYVLGFFSTQFSYGGSLRMIDAYTANEILWYYICNNIFLMMVEKLPGRLTKWETQKLMNNLETKRSFVRYVSHEIRTPLNTVFLGLDLVEHRLEANSIDIDAITGMVKELRESCLIATEILNDLLNYEKLDAGIMKLERTMVYPVPFIVKVLHPFHVQAEQKKINLYILRSQIEDENSEFKNWKLDIDESKMGQVLRNFVSNALKFTPPSGTVTVSITKVVSSDSTPSLRLEVRDSGHGISKENQRKVFNEIIQFNANTQQGGGGSGLGLWISKKLVLLHKGLVGLESEGIGRGCVFYLVIPMVRALTKDLTNYALEFGRSTTDPASTLLHNVMEGGSDSRGSCNSSIQENVENEEGRVLIRKKSISPIIPLRKIYSLLVVDDSKVNRRMLTKALGFAGHIVVDAGDGDEAVDLCNEALKSSAPFDAILLDCNMPRMNGIEAASLMRQAGFKGFIIGVTGNGMEEDVADFMSHGADAVIVKPMDLSKFQSTMESLEGKVVQTLREKERPVSFNSSSLL